MCLTTFDEKKYRITLQDEAYEDGMAVGLKQKYRIPLLLFYYEGYNIITLTKMEPTI